MAFVMLAAVVGLYGDAAIARAAATTPADQVRIWTFITNFGTSGYMFAISALVTGIAVFARGWARDEAHRVGLTRVAARASYFFACIALSGIAAQTIKHAASRMRPAFLAQDGAFAFLGPSWHHGADSFPSGHTTSAFAAAVALGLMMPRLRFGLAICAVLIGISRVITHNHYPSDVLCGALLGSSVSLLTAVWLADRGYIFVRPGEVDHERA